MDVGILALQGDVAEHRAALSEIGVASRPVRRPEDLVGLDGVIIPGGESTTISMLLESSGLADPLGKELDAGLPALGTCAGMILLATEAVDGRADQRCYGVDRHHRAAQRFRPSARVLRVCAGRARAGGRAAARRVHQGTDGRDDRS